MADIEQLLLKCYQKGVINGAILCSQVCECGNLCSYYNIDAVKPQPLKVTIMRSIIIAYSGRWCKRFSKIIFGLFCQELYITYENNFEIVLKC
jgi:hypothetical protein